MNALKAGRSEEARKSLTELLAANPEPWVHVFIAEAWCSEGNRDKAFAELDVAVSAFEKDPGSAGPMGCMLDMVLVEDDSWQPIRADPRFAPMLARAKKAAWHPQVLEFDESAGSQAPATLRPSIDAPESRELRRAYPLESVVAGATSDVERVRRMCRWVHERTSHDGWNDDLPKDVLGLLRAAEKGAQWRCV